MKFENEIVINQPVQVVFSYLADLRHVPEWNYAIESTTPKDISTIGVGARYVQRRTLPYAMTEELEIAGYDQDKLLAVSGDFAVFSGVMTYTLVSVGGATRLVNRVELEAKGAAKLLAPIAAMQLKGAVKTNMGVLKRLLES